MIRSAPTAIQRHRGRLRLCDWHSSKRLVGDNCAEGVAGGKLTMIRRRNLHSIGSFGTNGNFVQNANRHRERIRNYPSAMKTTLPIWTRTMATTVATARRYAGVQSFMKQQHPTRMNPMLLYRCFGSMTTCPQSTATFHVHQNPWVVALGIAALTSTVAAAWTSAPASNNNTDCESVENVPPLLDPNLFGTTNERIKGESKRDKSNIGARIIGNPPHRGSSPDKSTVEEDSGRPNSSFAFYEYLLEQLQVVRYVEDRDAATITSDSGRNKPTGLVGLACAHCMRQGRLDSDSSIFPQDRRSLAKEISTKMYDHVSTCPHVPALTKEKLQQLHKEHCQRQRDATGGPTKKQHVSRDERLFFRDLWYQMGHKDMPNGNELGKRPSWILESNRKLQ